MIKRPVILSCLLVFALHSQAQFDTTFIKTNLHRCADSLVQGFKARDWDKFTRYSNPALVGSIGGKKEFSNYISSMFNQIPDTAWKKYEPGKIIQVIKKGGDYLAVIELNTMLIWQDAFIKSTTYLVGESWDGGMFWTFFDSQGDRSAAQRIYPDLPAELVIPARSEIRDKIKN